MTAADGALFTPEVLSHPVEPLGLLRFLRRLVDNPLATWPQAVFEEKTLEVPFGKRGLLFVMDPPLVDEVLVGKAASFPKAPIIRRTIGPAVGDDSIFTAEGAAWRWQRRAASPPFRHGTILSFLPAFTASAIATVDRLGASSGETVDMAEAMMETTFDVIVETMLSGRTRFDTKRFGEEISRYFDTVGWIAAYTTLRLPDWLPYPGRRRAMAGNRFLRAEMARVIAERRIAPSPVPDLLDALIAATDPEDGRAMTDAELADNLLTFVVAGHETTALALTWALWLVGHAPAVEARLLDEVERVVGAGPVEAAHIEGLAYTKQVIQEAMRLYPPAPIIPRIAAEDVTLGDRQLAKGTPSTFRSTPFTATSSSGTTRRLRSRPLRAREGATAAPRRLSALRRGPAHLHRRGLRPDRGGGDPGDPHPVLAIRAVARSQAHADDAADAAPRGRHADAG